MAGQSVSNLVYTKSFQIPLCVYSLHVNILVSEYPRVRRDEGNSPPFCDELQRGYQVRAACIVAKNPYMTGMREIECPDEPVDRLPLSVSE